MAMNVRIPPHDMGAEGAVIAAALLDKRVADEVPDLSPDHFYSDAHGLIWEAIQSLRASGEPCDVVRVKAWLHSHQRLDRAGGASYLMQVMDASPAVANVRSHADVVRARWVGRRALAALQRAEAELYLGVEDEAAHVNAVADMLGEIAQGRARETMLPVRSHLESYLEQIKAAASGAPTGRVMTGLSDLDQSLGGLWPGSSTVVAGRPGMGKSALAFQIGTFAAEAGIGVVGFSLEMPGPEVAGRIVSISSGVPTAQMRTGSLSPDQFSSVVTSMAKISPIPFWIDSAPGPTIQIIRAKCRRLSRKLQADGQRLGLVIVDYLQLARSSGQRETREGEVSEISRGCKEIALELGCAVMALSQLNRNVESRNDKRPLLADLRESGSIEQDADTVLFIYRDEVYTKEASNLPGIAEVDIAKQRNGPTGTVHLGWDGPTTSFRDPSPSQRDLVESHRRRNANGE